MALTPKQERFCHEYLIDHNATQAALRAGYSPRTANEQGSQLLAKLSIQERIEELTRSQQARLDVQADDVLRELLLIARSDIGQVLDFTGQTVRLLPARMIPEHARRAIAGIKVRRYTEGRGDDALEVEVTEFKLWDKLAALDKLGKHLGLWRDTLDLHLKDPYKVYLGIDPREALGPTTSNPATAPTDPAATPPP